MRKTCYNWVNDSNTNFRWTIILGHFLAKSACDVWSCVVKTKKKHRSATCCPEWCMCNMLISETQRGCMAGERWTLWHEQTNRWRVEGWKGGGGGWMETDMRWRHPDGLCDCAIWFIKCCTDNICITFGTLKGKLHPKMLLWLSSTWGGVQ